jgi:hypothetical protein
MSRPEDTVTHLPSAPPAGDATIEATLAGEGTLAGDGTFADEPEATVDAERTLFDAAASRDEDRTLAGDDAEFLHGGDATLLNDPTLEEDRTLAE